ncbi:TetR/AcrR family transcriptional regulator [Dactylosporangium darangshiense]|uniref:TetR/AcrR family transcriptional regulator C-terminal domain-containing protein n=1 Tax=Dactylosporangium darangshiense TaxID=579108 RepID=A0ABP8DI37_9ACTN
MPRDTLSRDQIVRTAVELLDEEGLDGLNMRALGKRLNSAATAVYWHVGSKENLIALAADRLWSDLPLPDPDEVGWRPAATATATAVHAMLTGHPWLVQAFGSYVLFGAGKARHDDHSLAVFEAAGFVGAAPDRASAAVFTFVLGNALGVAAAASMANKMRREGGDAAAQMAEAMAQARAVAAQFPRLRARLETASADYAAAPDDTFATGLTALLDGLEQSRT